MERLPSIYAEQWRKRLPIIGRETQLNCVDINCHRKRITAPLTLVLGLSCVSRGSPQKTRKLRLFRVIEPSLLPKYMHFSKCARPLTCLWATPKHGQLN